MHSNSVSSIAHNTALQIYLHGISRANLVVPSGLVRPIHIVVIEHALPTRALVVSTGSGEVAPLVGQGAGLARQEGRLELGQPPGL